MECPHCNFNDTDTAAHVAAMHLNAQGQLKASTVVDKTHNLRYGGMNEYLENNSLQNFYYDPDFIALRACIYNDDKTGFETMIDASNALTSAQKTALKSAVNW